MQDDAGIVSALSFSNTETVDPYSDGESEENVDALTTLWRRLRAEAERAAASPSERLLDDALLLLNAPSSSAQRQRQARDHKRKSLVCKPHARFAQVPCSHGLVEAERSAASPSERLLDDALLLLLLLNAPGSSVQRQRQASGATRRPAAAGLATRLQTMHIAVFPDETVLWTSISYWVLY